MLKSVGTYNGAEATVVTRTTITLPKQHSSPAIKIDNSQTLPKTSTNTRQCAPLSPTHCKASTLTKSTPGKTYKHLWTPTGYVSPAMAMRRHSRVDMVREQVRGWGSRVTKGGSEGVGRIFDI